AEIALGNYSRHIGVISITAFFGSWGGFALAVHQNEQRRIRLPFSLRFVKLNFFGDMILGAIASIASLPVWNFLQVVDLRSFDKTANTIGVVDLISLAGWSILAGFLGVRLIVKAADMLYEKLGGDSDNLEQDQDEIYQKVQSAYTLIAQGEFEQAEKIIVDIADVNNDVLIAHAHLLKEKAEVERAKEKGGGYWDAVNLLKEAIKKLSLINEGSVYNDKAFYYRGCYEALLASWSKDDRVREGHQQEAVEALQKAVALDHAWREAIEKNALFADFKAKLAL
ncbi:hypothetical protein ACQZV8_09725, partial [Magnetococcales bacterium HHB-1]